MATTTTPLDRQIEENLDHSLAELGRLVNQPSISSQGIGMTETAEIVATMLRDRGFEVSIMPTPGYPVVYAEAGGSSDRTLLCYNHYDVQPAAPLDEWKTPPFEPS